VTPASPSRRDILHTALAAGVGTALGAAASPARADPPLPADLTKLAPQIKSIREQLHLLAHQWLDRKQLARPDGFIYTVDVAQLMIYFAQAADAGGYATLHDSAAGHLVRDERDDPYTKGFVPWRWKANEKPDASGTTEALRLARALWLGAKGFNRPADAQLALKILDGYRRHEATDQGIWIIRNYFGFNTRSFASNSYLVDYDPDFIRDVASERKDAALAQLADSCYNVVKLAAAPSGLLYDIIQPEVATLYPELNLAAFSPNDVIQFSNCCTTAMSVSRGLPNVARKVLAFALNRLDDLRVYYLGRTGEPFNDKSAAVYEYSVLARLAARAGANGAAATVADRAMNDWKWSADRPDSLGLFMATEILLAMQALEAIKA